MIFFLFFLSGGAGDRVERIQVLGQKLRPGFYKTPPSCVTLGRFLKLSEPPFPPL